MLSLDERLEKLDSAFEKWDSDREEAISCLKEVGVSENWVRGHVDGTENAAYARCRNIILVDDSIARGARGVREVMSHTDLSYSCVRITRENMGVRFLEHGSIVCSDRLKEFKPNVRKELEKGINAEEVIEKLMEIHHMPPIRTRKLVYGIVFDLRNEGNKRIDADLNNEKYALREEAIAEGMDSGEIAELEGVSTQAIDCYIRKRGLHDFWKEKRREAKYEARRNKGKEARDLVREGKEARDLVRGAVLGVVGYLLRKEGYCDLAVEKTTSYFRSKRSNYRIRDLANIFQRYKDAPKAGRKFSLYELAKETEISFVQVGKILNFSNLKPMVRGYHKEVERLNEKQKLMIQRAFHIEMSTHDLAYFVGVSPWVVVNRFRKQAGKGKIEIIYPGNKKEGTLKYRMASEIYEARDAGFNREEICELTGCNETILEYALEYERKISSEIVRALRKIYDRKDVDRPYLSRRGVV